MKYSLRLLRLHRFPRTRRTKAVASDCSCHTAKQFGMRYSALFKICFAKIFVPDLILPMRRRRRGGEVLWHWMNLELQAWSGTGGGGGGAGGGYPVAVLLEILEKILFLFDLQNSYTFSSLTRTSTDLWNLTCFTLSLRGCCSDLEEADSPPFFNSCCSSR